MRTIAPHRDAQRNPLPAARLVKAARTAGVAAAPSRNAGAYLCNYVYWRALEAAAGPDGPGQVIFIHVPPTRLATARKKLFKRPPKRLSKKLPNRRRTRKPRAPRLNDLVRAGEAIVLAMISLAARLR
jgi:pyroglutamyl-peptidase